MKGTTNASQDRTLYAGGTVQIFGLTSPRKTSAHLEGLVVSRGAGFAISHVWTPPTQTVLGPNLSAGPKCTNIDWGKIERARRPKPPRNWFTSQQHLSTFAVNSPKYQQNRPISPKSGRHHVRTAQGRRNLVERCSNSRQNSPNSQSVGRRCQDRPYQPISCQMSIGADGFWDFLSEK